MNAMNVTKAKALIEILKRNPLEPLVNNLQDSWPPKAQVASNSSAAIFLKSFCS